MPEKVNRFGEPCHAPGRPRGARARVNKYGNTPTNGHASKREAKRAAELRLLEKAGQIRDLREQVKFELIPKQDGERACTYAADFAYFEPVSDKSGDYWSPVYEDCKGFRTPVYRLKRKLMLHVHGIRVRET